MTYILLIFTLLFIHDLKLLPSNQFNPDYLSKKQTTNINGIFVFLVFMSHASQYILMDRDAHQSYQIFQRFLGQGVVASFLLYSGYGMMISITNKGSRYIKSIPSKFFKLFLYFNAALLFYLLLNIIIQRSYPLKHTLLAFTSWTSIGNSNWYITAILLLYISVFISFMLTKDRLLLGICMTTILTILIVYIQMRLKRPGYTYNTMIVFPLGMLVAYFKEKIKLYIRTDFIWVVTLCSLYILSSFAYLKRYSLGIETYSIWILTFSIILVLLSRKVILINPMLEWFGERVFTIYILQRIPMTLLAHWGVNSHYLIFFILSLLATCILSFLFESLIMKKIDLCFS